MNQKYSSPLLDNEGTDMQELSSLQREIQALKKENEFLKHTKISMLIFLPFLYLGN
ncbi:hypothetical protein [Bacillus thuringiensis]|uniref:hypothetical protein n=1 Tax=Bacillus thuringiensis TaxID=1428 RepID=UPI00211D3A8E|nr:hypothetical protein [Bacillus thuringiensis]